MRLLNLTDIDDINALLQEYRKASEAIMEEMGNICFYMRGGVTWEEVMNMPPKTRNMLAKVVKDGYEKLKKLAI